MRTFPRKKRGGFTLVEIMVSVLLIATVVMSIFPLLLTTKQISKKTGHRAEVLNYIHQIQQQLKNYVTADPSFPLGGPGTTMTGMLPGDTCASCTWALAAGLHDVTSTLPASFTGAPVSGTLTYTVTDTDCGLGGGPNVACKQVVFSASWTE